MEIQLWLKSPRPFRFFIRLLFVSSAVLLMASESARAASAVRLEEIFAVRFRRDVEGLWSTEAGLLNAQSGFRVFEQQPVAPGVEVPLDLADRWLITGSTWFAYNVLGSEALANFVVGGSLIFVGEQNYFSVTVADHPKPIRGDLVNLSTRAVLSPNGEPVIAGFVVTGGRRRILLRAVGPSLGILGVAMPLPDPVITLYSSGSVRPLAMNDNWGQSADVNAIDQAQLVTGAFLLSPISKDAACLVELEPGVYTAHVTTTGAAGGTVLVEAYTLP
jgi:hypothetical protein